MAAVPSRLACRSPNAFTPSIALWQHFVLPNCPIHICHRYASTVSATEPRDSLCALSTAQAEATNTTPSIDETKAENPPRAIPLKGKSPPHKDSNNARQLNSRSHNVEEQWEDYKGLSPSPFVNGINTQRYWVRSQPLPWWHPPNASGMTKRERFAQEILEFYAWTKPTKAEKALRHTYIKHIEEWAAEVDRDNRLELMGSERTGLAHFRSDIDLRLSDRRTVHFAVPTATQKKQLQRRLAKLWRASVRQEGNSHYSGEVLHARYPLFQKIDRFTGLKLQVVASSNPSKPPAVVERYIQEYPNLCPIYSVLKVSLDMRGLSNVHQGGLGSYSLFMMVVAALKSRAPDASEDVVQQLLDVLHFWANFNTYFYGVAIEPELELFQKGSRRIMSRKTLENLDTIPDRYKAPFLLNFEDPADRTNDLGVKARWIKHVQATFDYLGKRLGTLLKDDLPSQTLLHVFIGVYPDIVQPTRDWQEIIGAWFLENPGRTYKGFMRASKAYDNHLLKLKKREEGFLRAPQDDDHNPLIVKAHEAKQRLIRHAKRVRSPLIDYPLLHPKSKLFTKAGGVLVKKVETW